MSSILIRFLAISVATLAANALLALPSMAQQVYRIVGPDGRITFSDQPPPVNSAARVTTSIGAAGGGAGSNASLPFELRQIANRYPVTIYTSDNCAPCQSARAMLIIRGVPFTEKTILTPDDTQALQRLSGGNAVPFATIGGQQLKGYADTEWTQFLNAAGYPATSMLPASYRPPAATPLVAAAAAPAASPAPAEAQPAASAAPELAPAPVEPAQPNPAGIQF